MVQLDKLYVWEGSEDYRTRLESAKKRFEEISAGLRQNQFTCTYVGDLRFDLNEDPEVWLSDSRPLSRDCKTLDAAKSMAIRYGICGWWTLDDLKEFANGGGPIFNEAMWGLGYRKAKTGRGQWARKRKDDGTEDPRTAYWEKKYGKQFMKLAADEEERLNQLWAMPNESAGMSRTYDIQAGKTGLVYVALWANPFAGTTAETLSDYGRQVNNRFTIARQQEGFVIDAKNVQLGGQKGLYIKATRPDETYTETVWPSQIPVAKLYDLAVHE